MDQQIVTVSGFESDLLKSKSLSSRQTANDKSTNDGVSVNLKKAKTNRIEDKKSEGKSSVTNDVSPISHEEGHLSKVPKMPAIKIGNLGSIELDE